MVQKNIVISNLEDFEKKKKEFINSGAGNLHVIADFDETLTKSYEDNDKHHSTYAQLRKNNLLSPGYAKKAYELFDIYHPIEQDPNILLEEKNKKMAEWWNKHLTLMIKYGMSDDVVKKIIEKSNMQAREGCKDLLKILYENKIPLLIFSAGLGNVIKYYLELNNMMLKNIHIIANFYEFDKEGKVSGYKSKIVHTFNKNEVQVKNTPYYNQIIKRENVLLLGNKLQDIGMSEGIDHNMIIKIGFLNENKLLDKFKENYDVIILNDGSMDFVNDLIKEIIK